MQLRSLTLEDFKSYANATIEFAPGTNVIIGHNGAGKTTILEAIGFALFDHRPPNMNISDLVREGARTATVTVTFVSSHDEREYQVVRRCGGSSQYYVYDPEVGRKLAEGKADVLQFLRQHLGVDESVRLDDLFRNAVGVPQGTFTAAFLDTPANRQQIFNPLLRVEEYRQAFERLLEPQRLLKERQNEQRQVISGLEARVERLDQVRAEAEELVAAIRSAEEVLASLEAELEEVIQARTQAEAQEQAVRQQERRVEQARQQVARWRRELETAQQHLAEAREALAVVEANREGHQAYRAAQERRRELEARDRERRRLQAARSQVDRELAVLAQKRSSLEDELEAIQAAQTQVEALAEAVSRQEALEAALRKAEQEVVQLDATRQEVERLTRELDQTRDRIARLEEALAQLDAITAQEQEIEEHIQALEQRIAETRAEKARLQAELGALTKQARELSALDAAQCPVCEQPLTPEHRDELLARNQARQAEARQRLEALDQALAADEQALAQARADLRRLQKQRLALPRKEELDQVRDRAAALAGQLAEAQERLQDLAQAPEQVRRLQDELAALGDPRSARNVAAAQAARAPQVTQALETLAHQVQELTARLDALDRELAGFASLDEELAAVDQELARYQEADDLYRRHLALAERVPDREQALAAATEALAQAEATLTEEEAALARLQQDFDPQALARFRAQEQALREQRQELRARQDEQQRRLAQCQEEIALLEARARELEAAREALAQLEAQEELLGYFRNLLKEAGPYVTKALVEQISHGANQIFAEIMQDYSRELRWHEDYGITLLVDGRERPFGQLSGGEQMSAALAVRLALLREMSDIQVAFFDEPTTNLDEVRRDALARQILGIQGFHQLFVISHDDTFEQATDQAIRVQKVDGVSQVTVGVDPGE